MKTFASRFSPSQQPPLGTTANINFFMFGSRTRRFLRKSSHTTYNPALVRNRSSYSLLNDDYRTTKKPRTRPANDPRQILEMSRLAQRAWRDALQALIERNRQSYAIILRDQYIDEWKGN